MSNLAAIVTELLTQRRQMQQEIGRLDRAIAALRELGGWNGASPRPVGTRPTMPAATRRKLSQAMKAWWAKKSAPVTTHSDAASKGLVVLYV
jgi:hypothetical protein